MRLVFLAGPNGAGKSTYYKAFLAESPLPFLNADLVAADVGLDSFEAARMLDAARAARIASGDGFITETVFSDPHGAKLDMLRTAIAAGFHVTLIYIGVGTAELLARRIDARVAAGGHDVPRDKIASRFTRSLVNLKLAIPFVQVAKIYDNSSVDDPYRLLARFENGVLVERGAGRMPAWTRGIIPAKGKPRR
jgi:predicted ABC-type ATPase